MAREVKKFSPCFSRAARTHCVALLWTLVYTLSAANASAQYHIDSWTTSDGLPQSSVNDILQTHDGFLWLATFGGLVRYDGVTFKVFNTGNTRGLKSSRFLRLFEDGEGQLWITTENAGVTRFRDGVFNTYTTEDGLPDNYIIGVFYDRGGNLLMDTPDAVTSWKDGNFSSYTPRGDEPFRRPTHRSWSGAIWH